MTFEPGWTEARTDRLTELWSEGFSASQIGAEMGVTRNSVIGKVHRLKLNLRAGLGERKAVPHRTRSPRRSRGCTEPQGFREARLRSKLETQPRQATPFAPAKPVIPKPESKRLTLAELHAGMCKYIEDDFPPYTYCGHFADAGSPWCGFHYALCVAAKVSPKQANKYFDKLAQ